MIKIKPVKTSIIYVILADGLISASVFIHSNFWLQLICYICLLIPAIIYSALIADWFDFDWRHSIQSIQAANQLLELNNAGIAEVN